MRRSVTFSLAWLCAAGAATFAAGQGVALVTHAVTSDRPSALSASQVEADVAAGEGGSATTSTTAPPATTTSTTAAPVDGEAETVTRNVVGGTASFRVSPTSVEVVSATPKTGFDVEIEDEEGGKRVQFESGSHRSRVTAFWADGPQVEVDEDPR